MALVSSIERKGIDKGILQGRQDGARRQLLQVLRLRFDAVPGDVEAALASLDAERLEQLMAAALKAPTVASFSAQLNGSRGDA